MSSHFGCQKYCTVSPDGKKLEEVAEQVFEPGEDSPTSMAINAQVREKETRWFIITVYCPLADTTDSWIDL